MKYNHILISRTDSIGDVILTLPLAGLLKKKFPECRISFMGMPYTKEIIESSVNVDQFVDWNSLKSLPHDQAIKKFQSVGADLIIHVFPRKEIAILAKLARIPARMGTTGRFYHWFTCNKLVKISRKKSELHEALLNLKLAEDIHGYKVATINNNSFAKEITTGSIPALYGFEPKPAANDIFAELIDQTTINIILHPRSQGSAREWGLDNYAKLANQLSQQKGEDGKSIYRTYITGTAAEGDMLKNEGFFKKALDVVDLTGRFTLREFIQFINTADALIAGSTGPLHIAAAMGKIAIGLYPPIRPMHPGRWAPLGNKASFLVASKECSKCRNTNYCECMHLITIDQVQQKLQGMVSNNVSSNNHA